MKGPREFQFFTPELDRDIRDELAAHLEMRERDLVRRGMPPAEARVAARERFGDVSAIAGECRAIDEARHRRERRASMWTDLRQDIAYASRLLSRARGFTATAIATLALGIGGSTAIFSVIDAAVLRPLPYPDPQQLVVVDVRLQNPDGTQIVVAPSVEDVEGWRNEGSVFSHVATWDQIRPVVLDGPEPERIAGREISEDYLALHGVSPILGRGFTADETRYDGEPAVILGHGYWQRRFNANRSVIGQVIRLNDAPTTVVGVLPPGFYDEIPIFVPHRMNATMRPRRGAGDTVYGRLRPDIRLEDATRRLYDLTAARDLAQGQPKPHGIVITPLYNSTTRDLWSTASILAAAVIAILMIACINVGSLLLARAATRATELGVRASLGAGRGRLVRQLLTESLVLAMAGGAAGALMAWLSLDVIVASLPLALPENAQPSLNLLVLAFAAGLSLVTGILFGLAPALTLSRASFTPVLGRAGHRHGSPLSRRSGQLLIASEVALAMVLLVGAGLMIRSFARLSSVDVGFDPRSVITMEVVPVTQQPEDMVSYYPALVQRVRHVPGVESVGAVDHLPLAGSSTTTSGLLDGQSVSVNVREFLPGYFQAIGFEVRDGRLPLAAELTAGTPPAVVNVGAARQWFGGTSPVGRRLTIREQTYVIAAVVNDVRHRGPLRELMPEIWVPFPSFGAGRLPMIVVVRSELGLSAISPQLRHAAQDVGSRAVVNRIRSGSDWFADRVVTPRRRTILLGLLGGLALVLALVGIAGVTGYAVARRTPEIGVRMALGATPGQVVRSLLSDALWPTALGIVVGLGGATFTTRVIGSFLFETTPTHPPTLAVVAATMAAAAGLAAYTSARRAATVDPLSALRAE